MILPYLDKDLLYFMGKEELGRIKLLSKYHKTLVEENWFSLAISLLKSQNYIIYNYKTTISLIYKNTTTNCISLPKNKTIILRKISPSISNG